jgi:hypothetical protein
LPVSPFGKFNVSPKICISPIGWFSFVLSKYDTMKSKKVIQNIPAQIPLGEPGEESSLSTAGLSLEDLIEKKKLENEAYKKILKSLSINKNKSKL